MCDNRTWELIRAEYIAGGTSYAQLAKKYGVSKSLIGKRAISEGWQQLRGRIVDERQTKLAEQISTDQADKFMLMYSMSDKVQQRINELLDMPIKNGRQAHDLVDALNGTVQLIRDLYGLPGEQQMQGRQRLELMRRDMELKERQQQKEDEQESVIENWVIEYGDGDPDG